LQLASGAQGHDLVEGLLRDVLALNEGDLTDDVAILLVSWPDPAMTDQQPDRAP